MKILIVNKFLYPNGGSETYIFKLGEELKKQGHEVQYFGMEHEGRVVGNDAGIYTSGMDFHTGKLQKLLYPFKIIYSKEAYKKMYALMDEFRPDVVHLNNFNFQLTPSIIYAARDWEKKNDHKVEIIYTAHDSQLVCPDHLMMLPSGKTCFACKGGCFGNCIKNRCIHGSLIKSILGAIEARYYLGRKTYDLIDVIICPSEFLKSRLETYPLWSGKEGAPAKGSSAKGSAAGRHPRIVMMHNFLTTAPPTTLVTANTQAAANTTSGATASATNMTVDDAASYILYFGRYSEEKGVKTLLSVCRELPDVRFKFAGNGPLRPDVESLDNVTNLGFLQGEELYNTIKNAKLVIFPSECYENCPFTVMESISYGTPVIGSDIGGVPELLNDGVTGELFEPGNKEDLRKHIESLLSDKDKLERYSANCRETKYSGITDYTHEFLRQIQ